LSRGYGAQITSISAGSGTFSKVSPYDGVANNIGITDTVIRRIMTSSGPVVGGTSSVTIKAKAASTDAAASDYTETNTMLVSGNF
jgi:hypothetical protein